jgi:hypothetical protein
MQTYTVHESPNPLADRLDRAEQLVFVRDGFSWSAAFFGPFWLLAHRLWWPFLGYVLLAGGFELLKSASPLDERWIGLCAFALNVLVGFEADTLRRWALQRRGWHTLGSVTGRTAAECERRFFEAWLPSQPILAGRPAGVHRVPDEGLVRRAWGTLVGARP